MTKKQRVALDDFLKHVGQPTAVKEPDNDDEGTLRVEEGTWS